MNYSVIKIFTNMDVNIQLVLHSGWCSRIKCQNYLAAPLLDSDDSFLIFTFHVVS